MLLVYFHTNSILDTIIKHQHQQSHQHLTLITFHLHHIYCCNQKAAASKRTNFDCYTLLSQYSPCFPTINALK